MNQRMAVYALKRILISTCSFEEREALEMAIDALKQPQIIRCKDCKHRPTQKKCFPDTVCPCQCSDSYYSWVPPDDWYCADGERKGGEQE